jgi:hypothetical protein
MTTPPEAESTYQLLPFGTTDWLPDLAEVRFLAGW